MTKRSILFLLLALSLAPVGAAASLTNCLEITQALQTTPVSSIPFDVRATITCVDRLSQFSVTVQDETGGTWLNSESLPLPEGLETGMMIHATGRIIIYTDKRTVTECQSFEILGTNNTIIPEALTIREAHNPDHTARLVRLTGCVQDLWIDETDPRFVFFVLQDETGTIYGSFLRSEIKLNPESFIGARISACGTLAGKGHHPKRPYMNTEFCLQPQEIKVISAGGDPFDSPMMDMLKDSRQQTARTQSRYRLRGEVLAAWGEHQMLVRTDQNEKVLIDTLNSELPPVHTTIDAVGIPVVNIYRANLVRAIWRSATVDRVEPQRDAPRDISLADLLTDGSHRRKFNVELHGTPLRVTGEVRNYDPSGEILLHQDGLLLPVHIGNGITLPPNLAVGCVVSATGVCVIDTESWGDNSLFPAIRSCSLVLRSDDDLRILRHPPWWTPRRVRILILVLMGCIALAAVWIILLRRVAEQRGRTLAKESVAHAETTLKVYERSRLAVELHDTISQNLTGAVWQIRSAMPFYTKAPDQPHHLDIALKTIDSCRGELRNCIWDLRNNALEETEIDEAIRLTLRPIVNEPALSIRFNVPRERLTDTTLHAILSVIREFVSNAIRHGNASEIKVAGTIDNDQLLFSVRDNGRGFVPADAPGMDEGHFGLQGVRERLRPLGGTLSVDSRPGHGCKCTVSINLSQHTRT